MTKIAPVMERVETALADLAACPDQILGPAAQAVIARPGKRLRPLLAVLGAVAAGVDPGGRVIQAAAAVEMLHLASILHDDVIDDASIRGGASTINACLGNIPAVLLGDFFFARSLRAAAGIGPDCLDGFLAAAESLVRGEFGQAASTDHLPDLDSYLGWIGGKTGRLFALAASLGAVQSSDWTAGYFRALADFGQELGVAYQIRDDLLDLIADQRRLGKPVLSDFRRGIYTYPAILAGRADPEFPGLLSGWRAGDPDLRRRALAIMKETGALDGSMEACRGRAAQAIGHLACLPPGPARNALTALAAWVARCE